MWPLMRDALLRQRGHLLLWAPVALGSGIGAYFALRAEPSVVWLLTLAAIGAAVIWLGVRWCGVAAEALAPLIWALALVALGLSLAGLRARMVAAPVLEGRYYGPIIGTVERIDRSASGAPRLLLRDVSLPRWPGAAAPDRVRVSLHGDQRWIDPAPGQRVMTTGHLSPPGGPVEPGGFDFRRHAWFIGLGAVGYSRNPAVLLEPAPGGGLAAWRHRVARRIEAQIGGAPGAFAAAITTGDRASLPPEDVEALRRSNLAHLLAISGLHMGLLTGFVMVLLRGGLALIPGLALRWPLRKLAAAGAILAGAGYLMLSGGAVSTERAFIMVSVALVAVLIDRRALTLRVVALAALVVLLRRPEALTGPGFQMSFAATTALVVVFGALRGRPWARNGAVSLFLSSLIAGVATAPFAMAHFNQLSQLGLLANLVSVPVMGLLVMPAAVLAALLSPFGAEGIALWGMEIGLRWILFIAHRVSEAPGAVSYVPRPPGGALPLIACGALFTALWQGRARLLGAVPVALAATLWVGAERPPMLVAETGGLAGLMTSEGRSLTRPRGDGFAATLWLENDGAPVPQKLAAERAGWDREERVFRARLGQAEVLSVRGKQALAALEGCGGADLLIANAPTGPRPCRVYGPDELTRAGALAVWPQGEGLRIVSARYMSGARMWNSPEMWENSRQ